MSKTRKKSGGKKFWRGMLIYAVVFLLIVSAGLVVLWNYMDAFEESRPKVAINSYMEGLTAEHICDLSQDIFAQADRNLQSEEELREYVCGMLENISYAKKTKECTDERQVFVLRTGTKVIGEFTIAAQEPGRFGFTIWKPDTESFDLSALNLFEGSLEITVPSDHTVTVNGFTLDETYLVEERIIYEELEDYYEDYELPYKVKYQVDSYAGEPEVVIRDAEGNVVTIDENTDWSRYFNISDEDEVTRLSDFVQKYVQLYVAYTGSTRENCEDRYNELMPYIVRGTEFAFRLTDAVSGLMWGQSQGDTIASVTINHRVKLEEGRYMCDFTYEVDTTGREGVVRTTTNARVIIVESKGSLKVESMSVY